MYTAKEKKKKGTEKMHKHLFIVHRRFYFFFRFKNQEKKEKERVRARKGVLFLQITE